MNTSSIPASIKDLIFESLSLTHDGIGVFDAQDNLIYCNEIMASMFSLPVETATGMSFDELIKFNFEARSGLLIEAETLDSWLEMAHRTRRSKKFRSFEVDRVDNRWFLVTEHTAADDTLLIFCSEITRQKNNEAKLVELNQKLTDLAYRDHLTNSFNRRYFYEVAEIELSRCTRQDSRAALLMLDLDDFKTINDSYGHEGGDIVLVEMTELVRDLLRNYDIFGRVGGEEFAILLPDTELSEAIFIANRILDGLRVHYFAAPLNVAGITASIGAVERSDYSDTLVQLIRAADLKLYQAKREGKDRVVH